jgi:hypothetical protein
MGRLTTRITIMGVLGVASIVHADEPPVAPDSGSTTPEPADAAPSPSLLPGELEKVQLENQELREQIEFLREDLKHVEDQVETLLPIAAKVTGYLDFGFFHVGGDGSGIRSDIGYNNFPEYAASGIPDSWVFMGDPLSVAVNARGEPATTGESRALRFDGVKAGGATFLVNTLNVGLFAEVGRNAIFTSKIDFLPRGRDISQPDGVFLGDFVDIRLAYLEYRVRRTWMNVSVFAGKFDSAVGFEYRSQEAPTRIEVTPSLICRYTCGYPVGIKARAQFFSDALVLNVAVTNGSSFTEGFAFHNEVDTNNFKTVSGRVSYSLPSIRELELGVSGSFGAQDNQTNEQVYQWMYGADVHFHRQNFVFRGELIKGRAKGETDPGAERCGLTPCIEFKGAYGLVGYRVTNIVMPYVRVDWRDALHQNGASFVYLSELWRTTPGIRLTLTANVTIKAEYTVNRELGRIPQFANDVFTSALVVKY